MALAKKYGVIVLALVLLPIIFVIKKKKAKKAAVIDLESLPDQSGEKEAESSAEKPAAGADTVSDKSSTSDKKSEPKKKVKTTAKGKVAKDKTTNSDKEETKVSESEDEEPGDEEAVSPQATPVPVSMAPTPAAPAPTPAAPAPTPAAPAPPAPTAQADQPAPVITATTPVAPAPQSVPVAPPAPASYQTIAAKHQAEIEQLRELIRPGRRPPVQADPELDSLWGDLSRKAMQGRIAPQFRREETSGGYRPGSAKPSGPGAHSGNYPEPMAPDIDFNVSIDLSEESLKDDLTVKLKMMAISDGELREMFAQKNPKHIPHLLEYVLTKPEPVRLAFVARELGSYEDPAVIDVLAGLLYHEDHRVALAAIQGLENSKKVPAILHLCPFLKSEVPLLAQAARTALSNFGAVKIMQAFHNLSQNPDERIRSAGVFVMSRMKGAQVEELLKLMLNDDSLDVRCDVILAMSYQKSPVYLDSLREFFRIATDRDKTLARKAIVYLQGFVTRKK